MCITKNIHSNYKIFLGVIVLILSLNSYGFDTGWHSKATMEGVKQVNPTITSDALEIITLTNFLTDFYSTLNKKEK